MRIGVLALQGAFREHCQMLERCGVLPCEVRKAEQLTGLQGLVIPGGESTTIGKLMMEGGIIPAVKEAWRKGMAIFGTCAGMILMCKEIAHSDQPRLGLLDAQAHRNAFGRQKESFEYSLELPFLGDQPFPAIFIRAPYVDKCQEGCAPLGAVEEKAVIVQQGKLLACAFHPELTEDTRLHDYFIRLTGGENGPA